MLDQVKLVSEDQLIEGFVTKKYDIAYGYYLKDNIEKMPRDPDLYNIISQMLFLDGDYISAIKQAKKSILLYEKQESNPVLPYIITYLSHLKLNNRSELKVTINYIKKSNKNIWASRIINYMTKNLNKGELLALVKDPSEELKAHTYIALFLIFKNNKLEAEKHLNWVLSKGKIHTLEISFLKKYIKN